MDACALFGMLNVKGLRFPSTDPVNAISKMRERENGLGGGFAVYGIYPDYSDLYALHTMYLDRYVKRSVEKVLEEKFQVYLP